LGELLTLGSRVKSSLPRDPRLAGARSARLKASRSVGGAMADSGRTEGHTEDPLKTAARLSLVVVDEANEAFAGLTWAWQRFHPSDRWTAAAWRAKSGTLRRALSRVDRQLEELIQLSLEPECLLDVRVRYLESCGQAQRALDTVNTSLDKLETDSAPQLRRQLREQLGNNLSQLEERLGEVITILLDLTDL
jgi:hypothetical protein